MLLQTSIPDQFASNDCFYLSKKCISESVHNLVHIKEMSVVSHVELDLGKHY